MATERVNNPTVVNSAALAAFQVAVVQQKQFEQNLERLSEERAKPERVEPEPRDVEDVVDVNASADNSNESSAANNGTPEAAATEPSRGAEVDVSI